MTPERILLAADVVLFRGAGEDRSVLLVRRGSEPYTGRWALPGGFVEPGEHVEDAARRELMEETGVRAGPLRQIGVWSDPGRDPRGRVVTVAFSGELPEGAEPRGGGDAAGARLWSLRALPPLAFDHADILAAARASRP